MPLNRMDETILVDVVTIWPTKNDNNETTQLVSFKNA